jgi:CPA2 family monovalent cation:H+ antiporter-2
MVLGSLGPESSFDMILLVKMFLAIGGLASIVWFFGRHKMVDLPFREELRRNRDILPVASLAACLMGAAAAEAMGMSASYGAFVAGLIIGNTSSRNELLEVTTPLQNAMLVVFFLSIGLMLDPRVIIRQWQVIVALLLILNVFKSVVSVWLLRIFLPRSHWRCSFFTGLTMGQIGEFSFILAAVSLSSGIFSIEEYRVVVSLIALSLTISPLWNVLARRFHEITFTPDGSVLGFRAAFRRLWAATPPRS